MASKFHHEELYRGADVLARLGGASLTLCGAGALGSHLADNLVRQGVRRLRVIDDDRVAPHNVSTQLYGDADVGGRKVDVLRNRLYRTVGVEIEAIGKRLTDRTARPMLKDCGLIVDVFDNSASRRQVQETSRELGLPCLHVGLAADYCEVIWDEIYRVPGDPPGDACDYPLARNLILLAVAIASETIVRFLIDGARHSWSATLRDFAVRPFE